MQLYFLRHGIAEDKTQTGSDAERALTEDGIRKMKKAAEGMQKLELQFDAVISSPLIRAKQTALLVVEGMKLSQKIVYEDALTPAADFKGFAKIVESHDTDDNLLFVGHMPSMAEFISQLISGKKNIQIDLKKGGLCRVDLIEPNTQLSGDLKWLLTNRQLRDLA